MLLEHIISTLQIFAQFEYYNAQGIIEGCKVEHLLGNIKALSIMLMPQHIAFLESVIPFDSRFPHGMIICCFFYLIFNF
jgi:hypothetical protein